MRDRRLFRTGSRVLLGVLCASMVYGCCGQAESSAQEAIHYSGRVVNAATAIPIEEATIRVIASSFDGEWRTDADGRFSFWVPRENHQQIRIEHEGYQSASLNAERETLDDIRLSALSGVSSGAVHLLGSSASTRALPPAESVVPAMFTADSEPKISGAGKNWSPWYDLGVGKAPAGYTVQKVDFWLTGDRTCGAWAECREITRNDHEVLWQFRLQGHDEPGAPPHTYSVAHIRVLYRSL